MNPFIFGRVVDDWQFIDRQEEIKSIAESLASGQHIICYSPRRYGKTSLMMAVKQALLKKKYSVFYIDLSRIASVEDLFNTYATSIVASLSGPVKNLVALIQQLLPAINPRIVLKSPENASVEITVPIPVLKKQATLDELFDSLEKYCAKNIKRGVVVFDEFQELSVIKDGDSILKTMRSSFQHHKHVGYAFCGSKNHMMKSIFRDKNRPFYNFGRHFVLDVIPESYWREYIGRFFGLSMTPEIIARILSASSCHPYYTQMICHYLWEQKSKKVTAQLVDEVVGQILARDALLFAEMWEKLNASQRRLCIAVGAEARAHLYEQTFLMKYNLGSASSVQKSAAKLFEYDYLKTFDGGEVGLVNPLFREWIVRR